MPPVSGGIYYCNEKQGNVRKIQSGGPRHGFWTGVCSYIAVFKDLVKPSLFYYAGNPRCFSEFCFWVKKMTEKSLDKLTATLSSKRWEHSLGVAATAAELAEIYGADRGKARLAGLIHDCAREMSNNTLLQTAEAFGIVVTDVDKREPILLHAAVGAVIARRDYGVLDSEVLHAIVWHTTGGPVMSLLDNIIFLADFIEPGRSYPGVDKLRALAGKSLQDALLAAYDQTVKHVIGKGGLLHPATVAGRNAILLKPQ